MIRTQDAIAAARALIGTPYKELDCINLIKRVIRTAPGGVKSYTTAGTNSLWNSYNMSAKYKDITWRQEGTAGARAGMLAFKRRKREGASPTSGAETGSFPARTPGTAQAVSGATYDVHHVGLVTDAGTVIHSSSVNGRGVVETALDGTWNLLAVHRTIEAAQEAREEVKTDESKQTTLKDEEGNTVTLLGRWEILKD